MKDMKEQKKITSFDELKKYSEGAIVELPPFSENQPFVARLCRPSVVDMMMDGTIPNELLETAFSLFDGGSEQEEEKSISDRLKESKETTDILRVIAEHTLVSPTYNDILESGLQLNDTQLAAIYRYTQLGVENLKSFRL